VVRQVLALKQAKGFTYKITGVVHSKTGRFPFETRGVLFEWPELTDLLGSLSR